MSVRKREQQAAGGSEPSSPSRGRAPVLEFEHERALQDTSPSKSLSKRGTGEGAKAEGTEAGSRPTEHVGGSEGSSPSKRRSGVPKPELQAAEPKDAGGRERVEVKGKRDLV